LHQLVLGRFLDAMADEIGAFVDSRLLDFGCGEGFFWKEMGHRGLVPRDMTGIDLRDDALETARAMLPDFYFIKQDLLTWQPEEKFDLVIASQVLEHLPKPGRFLEKLVSLTRGYLLLSVPWEPFFRLSNLARGRDILRLGNHPEHINLWSSRKFERFVSSYAEIVISRRVFPFLIIVCKPRSFQPKVDIIKV
jgi:2-polyprenyl-3-methyl-5-hydroxy-6-metoxy-1,4-benzoquinol methylase